MFLMDMFFLPSGSGSSDNLISVADPDPGYDGFLNPGSGIRDGKKSISGIRYEHPRSYLREIKTIIGA
jgi:hypothetical protein